MSHVPPAPILVNVDHHRSLIAWEGYRVGCSLYGTNATSTPRPSTFVAQRNLLMDRQIMEWHRVLPSPEQQHCVEIPSGIGRSADSDSRGVADRVRAALRRLGPMITGVTIVSCAAFALLPFVLSSVVLALTVAGLVVAERRMGGAGAASTGDSVEPAPGPVSTPTLARDWPRASGYGAS